MFERILVPLDGSSVAERALPMAARIARAFNGSISLLSVVEPPMNPGKFNAAFPLVGTDELMAEANEYLKTLISSNVLRGITVETHTLIGKIAPTILLAASSLQCTQVVLSSHGHTGPQRWRLGSVAEKVVRHASVPVLVVREGEREPVSTAIRQVSALVALDGSALSEAMLAPTITLVAALARSTELPGKIQLIRVVDAPTSYGKFRTQVDAFYDASVKAELKKADEEYLEGIAKRFSEGEWAQYHFDVTTTVTNDHDIAHAIVLAAEQGKVDFISMATHGRGGMLHWALGSVTERVLHATTMPLFIFRPGVPITSSKA